MLYTSTYTLCFCIYSFIFLPFRCSMQCCPTHFSKSYMLKEYLEIPERHRYWKLEGMYQNLIFERPEKNFQELDMLIPSKLLDKLLKQLIVNTRSNIQKSNRLFKIYMIFFPEKVNMLIGQGNEYLCHIESYFHEDI